MSWTNIDDRILSHPKMKKAVKTKGDAAWCMWSRGLVYTNAYDLDGRIPADVIDELTSDRKPFEVAKLLVDVGLWDARDDGDYQVHDFAEYNDSRAERDLRRRASKERLKKHRDRKAGVVHETPYASDVDDGCNAVETRFTHVADAKPKRVTKSVIPSQATPHQATPHQAVEENGSAPAAHNREQEVLTAALAAPVLAGLANLGWARALLLSAGTAGWKHEDILAGITEFQVKRGPSFASQGTPDPTRVNDALVGFIQTAKDKRRAGGASAAATISRGGSQGSPAQSPPRADLRLLPDEPEIVPAPLDDPARLACLRALSGIGGAG